MWIVCLRVPINSHSFVSCFVVHFLTYLIRSLHCVRHHLLHSLLSAEYGNEHEPLCYSVFSLVEWPNRALLHQDPWPSSRGLRLMDIETVTCAVVPSPSHAHALDELVGALRGPVRPGGDLDGFRHMVADPSMEHLTARIRKGEKSGRIALERLVGPRTHQKASRGVLLTLGCAWTRRVRP